MLIMLCYMLQRHWTQVTAAPSTWRTELQHIRRILAFVLLGVSMSLIHSKFQFTYWYYHQTWQFLNGND